MDVVKLLIEWKALNVKDNSGRGPRLMMLIGTTRQIISRSSVGCLMLFVAGGQSRHLWGVRRDIKWDPKPLSGTIEGDYFENMKRVGSRLDCVDALDMTCGEKEWVQDLNVVFRYQLFSKDFGL